MHQPVCAHTHTWTRSPPEKFCRSLWVLRKVTCKLGPLRPRHVAFLTTSRGWSRTTIVIQWLSPECVNLSLPGQRERVWWPGAWDGRREAGLYGEVVALRCFMHRKPGASLLEVGSPSRQWGIARELVSREDAGTPWTSGPQLCPSGLGKPRWGLTAPTGT